MTRLTATLFAHNKKNVQKFTNYVPIYPHKEKLPATLKDSVSLKGDRRKVPSCLQEISLMLVCLKQHEFSQKPCSAEIEAFLKCQQQHVEAKNKKLEIEAKGLMTSSSGRVNSKQLNAFLAKYPQPRF